jgi:succinate dehydrogenase/fumarate reductase-like Fe-S protein
VDENMIRASIFRYSPEEGLSRVDTFEVPYSRGMTFQTMLRYIYENVDPTLVFRDYRCGRGVCNTCSIKVNGKLIRSCETQVPAGKEVLIEPANDRVIRDLVVELD